MKITNFEEVGLDKLEEWIKKERKDNINKDDLKELLKYANVSFVFEGIDRVQSTLLCELKASYVQQSQRYVTMKEDSYIVPELTEEDNIKARELISKAFLLYDKMSTLKNDEAKGRPKVQDYLYGIPIEDARYILPLAAKTNISVAMSGDKVLDLFYLFNDSRYENIFTDIKRKFIKLLPDNLALLLKGLRKKIIMKLKKAFIKMSLKK
ncbi:FAD-dependent thymidylate synthase [Clostridium sp. DMHC 10]|uniref:FAD-dependent thymidylate synthase n=1 Tax=Clostridium sp. DMHC 10 TaxID=747377 RepID=UPI001FA77BB8|nr:FAD-dependent thymidylate synthase [Clostridium sp. DMHC 10]